MYHNPVNLISFNIVVSTIEFGVYHFAVKWQESLESAARQAFS